MAKLSSGGFALLVAGASMAGVAGACGSGDNGSVFDPTRDGGFDGAFQDAPPPGDGGPIVYNDFAQPILDVGVPANAPQIFGAPGQSSGGPCLFEPELGSLFPNNWLRPRLRFTAANQENLFEFRFEIPNEASPLIIYTTKSAYTFDKVTWGLVSAHGVGGPIHVTVRSAVVTNGVLSGGPFTGSTGDIEVAPVAATGSVVYWTTSAGTVLKGFKIGDETVQSVITPTQAGTQCVACHASTPDGQYVAMSASDDPANGDPARIVLRSADGNATPPPFLTANAAALLGRLNQHTPTFSTAHWTNGDHVLVSMLDVNGKSEIIWTDLEAKGQTQGTDWGVLLRNGDANGAANASWSHDGNTIVYASATSIGAGTNTNTDGQLMTVPFGNRAGGTAAPVNGANAPGQHQFYPAFSADDRFLAYNRVADGATSYNNSASEVFVIPAGGGSETRLIANDPPACLGVKSPGVTNSWPKWSPEVKSFGGKDYYFLVFSSTRNAATNGPQLYVAPMVVSGGKMTTYAALYLWNQPEAEHNHTPAWDVFKLAPPK